MPKFIKIILCLVVLLIGVLALPIRAYYRSQLHQQDLQTRILERNFLRVQRQGNKVLVVPVPHHHSLFRIPNPEFFLRPASLAVGSQFKATDRHWGATYTIMAIQPDGVLIRYEAEGQAPADIRPSAGSVFVPWK